jgi:hypothetical protein
MKTVAKWDDLTEFGIEPLTGEACGLGYRILCDVTEKGRLIVEKCLGAASLVTHLQWNSGTKEQPHIGSLMLAPEMLVPLAVFALLESGCKEVYAVKGGCFGIEYRDPPDTVESLQRWHAGNEMRRLAYQGTARDRNVHVMSGRVE